MAAPHRPQLSQKKAREVAFGVRGWVDRGSAEVGSAAQTRSTPGLNAVINKFKPSCKATKSEGAQSYAPFPSLHVGSVGYCTLDLLRRGAQLVMGLNPALKCAFFHLNHADHHWNCLNKAAMVTDVRISRLDRTNWDWELNAGMREFA
ncbi:hypothetical protein C8J57DRAFT_1251005 [Mycena rebaudengoi]|nr:hypothetical protein C8J57DRAFT_1251005 [Mycena rebaudengoi]